MNNRVQGFTLIEVMITTLIIGIIAVIAVPAYNGYVMKSRRSEATTALLGLQLAQERWRSNNTQYTTSLGDLGSGAQTSDNNYNLAISSANATSFFMTATATGKQSGDTACSVIAIDENGPVTGNVGGTDYDAACWK